MNGQPLRLEGNGAGGPFITQHSVSEVEVNVWDWVGRLHFTSTDGRVDELRYVYPAKLDQNPVTAFAALARMADTLPELTAPLGYPTTLVPDTGLLQTQPLTLDDLEACAQAAWRMTQTWQRTPRWSSGPTLRTVRGGVVPGRVDWELTLAHWGRGGLPEHVTRELTPPTQPPGLRALRELWTELAGASAALPHGAGTVLHRRCAAALGRLPEAVGPVLEGDPLSRAAGGQLAHLRRRRQAGELPTGHACMPDIYELWVQASLLRALGAQDGSFTPTGDGRYAGTFQGPGVTVTINPRLGFRGIGPGVQSLMPDLLAEFSSGMALIVDVKYRPLHHLSTEQVREVNRQLLSYMGLTYARVGVAVWPAPEGEAWRETPLPGGRARLLRLRGHPLDPPGTLAVHLHALALTGDP